MFCCCSLCVCVRMSEEDLGLVLGCFWVVLGVFHCVCVRMSEEVFGLFFGCFGAVLSVCVCVLE